MNTLGNTQEVSKGLGMVSIKETIKGLQLDEGHQLEIERKRYLAYLTPLILRTEKALIAAQNEDLPNEARIKSIEQSFTTLMLVYGHIEKQNSIIRELEHENKLLKARVGR